MRNYNEYEYVLIGGGLHNCVLAYLLKQAGKRCLILEKDNAPGGVLRCKKIAGIYVHEHGPHIFHTNNTDIWNFVNQHVKFNNYINTPIALGADGKYYNMPFNMNTFRQMWGDKMSDADIRLKLALREKSTGIPTNLEEKALMLVDEDIYNNLIKGYTEKAWGKKCTELSPEIISRIPVRAFVDNNYYSDLHQGIPFENNYNALIENLIRGIDIEYNVKVDINWIRNNIWDVYPNSREKIKVICSGSIDEFFGYSLGELEYRSRVFTEYIKDSARAQFMPIINICDGEKTKLRSIEYKYLDIDNGVLDRTVIQEEHAEDFKIGHNERYYPIPTDKHRTKHASYLELAKRECPSVTFAGRLGTYRYLDMDDVIEMAFDNFKKLA